ARHRVPNGRPPPPARAGQDRSRLPTRRRHGQPLRPRTVVFTILNDTSPIRLALAVHVRQQDPMSKTAVVALGGNALTRPGQTGTAEEMLSSAAEMAASVNEVIQAGWRVVLVHGNGPQVGNLALQQESTSLAPAQPLAALGAMTQGQLGSLLALAIDRLRGPGSAVSVVTHVTVDRADPAFGAPTKPIGPFFGGDRARRLAAEGGWTVRPAAGRGYRRVVASPQPTGIVEINAIRALVEAGLLVIAAGGGGIPVTAGSVAAGAGGPAGKDSRARDVFPEAGIGKGRPRPPPAPPPRAPAPPPVPARRPGMPRLPAAPAGGPGHDHGRRGRAPPGRGPVPVRQHGPEDRGRAGVPGQRRRAGGDHDPRTARRDPLRRRSGRRHADRAEPVAKRAGPVSV